MNISGEYEQWDGEVYTGNYEFDLSKSFRVCNMTHRIEGWCIISSRDGSRWGGLYESESGAKASWWNWTKWLNIGHEFSEKKFNEQSVYILQPLVLLLEDN